MLVLTHSQQQQTSKDGRSLPLTYVNCVEVDRPRTMYWAFAKLHWTLAVSHGHTSVWPTKLWTQLMKSTQCTVTCQGTLHPEVVLFHLNYVWLHRSRTLWSLTITRRPSTFLNSPAQQKGILTFATLRKATNMLTSPLISLISVAKWIVLRCLLRDSFQQETIPHWTHFTSLSNRTSLGHNSSQTSLPSPSQPPITSSCARMSPPF